MKRPPAFASGPYQTEESGLAHATTSVAGTNIRHGGTHSLPVCTGIVARTALNYTQPPGLYRLSTMAAHTNTHRGNSRSQRAYMRTVARTGLCISKGRAHKLCHGKRPHDGIPFCDGNRRRAADLHSRS